MMLQLTHIRLLVTNYTDCFFFYRDVLGFWIDWGDENSGYAELHTGDNLKLALFRKDFMAEAIPSAYLPSALECQNKMALIFAVDNVDAVYEKLKERNVVVVTQPLDRPAWGLRTAHFRDPDGNLIEIFSNLGTVN
ncbi:VOC family protein [Nostoc sp. LEGE 06077]|uniref:VOC family protein n=1 Tax=Nostoc sp. LEGE 06077 TaxID=915325 RepID=UPI00187F2A3F|nr:VOC family protein [Nostoc sp. LEGE 06077]MBE9204993.1 VOC family protein [Nostoc sp. LEGE 06077]